MGVERPAAAPTETAPPRSFGIRTRLILLVLGAALPLLLLIGWSARQQIEQERTAVLLRASVRARLLAARIDDQIGNIDTLLIGLSRIASTNPADIGRNEALFRSIAAELPPYFLNVKAQSLDGGALGSTSGNREINVADRSYFQKAIAGSALVVDEPVVSRSTGRWSLTLARPLVDPAGAVAGMVGVSFDLVRLSEVLDLGSLPDGSVISVIDAKQVVLARSEAAEQWIGRENLDTPEFGHAAGNGEGSVEFTAADGTKLLAGYATCQRAPWRVYARVPSAIAYAGAEQQFRRSLLFGLATLVLTLALAWLIGDRITRPLRRLAGEAAVLGAGGDHRISRVTTGGEVGQLAHALNEMLARVAERDTALRRSEAQFRMLIESAADGIFITTPEGVYAEVNASGAAMLGWSREDLIGRGIADILVPEEHPRIAPQIARLLAGEAVVGEWRFLRKDGSSFPGEVSATMLPDGRLLGSVRDATDRKRVAAEREQFERRMQETQKLESLGVLAGGIAHDFNNLLTGILGNASMAGMELPGSSPVQTYVENIKQGSLRAAELCKQMLAYSGRGRFVVQKIQINQLVEETAHLLQISISKQAVLRFNLYPELPAIEADATQIRQVIMNLVINASEAIGTKSGLISLSTGLTRVDRAYLGGTLLAPELPDGTYVYLEVSDNGSGMTPETKARIFEPFYTTKFTGRGLGLAAVLGIVRGHKGALKVYSEPGRGTTFKLLFPCASGAADAVVAEGKPKEMWRGHGCVLVVDDEESVRSTAALMLQKLGFDVALAADGREAVDAFRAEPGRYTLVLLDLTMPHLDGEQAYAEIRRIRADARVILMSGFNQQEAISRFTGKGLASFLQKPFQFEALSRALQDVLEGRPGPE